MKQQIPAKAPSLIEKISLPAPLFEGDLVPAEVNLFYGANGSGKSTLAKAISEGSSVSYREGVDAKDTELLLFDKDFAEKNLAPGKALPGIFLLGQQTIDSTGAMDVLRERRESLEKEIKEKRTELKNFQEESEAHWSVFIESLWSAGAFYRKNFPKCLGRAKSTKRSFAYEIMNLSRTRAESTDSEEELLALYRTVFGDATRKIPLAPVIADPQCIDALPGVDMLAAPLASREDTPFAAFMNALAATDWFRYGHDHMEAKAGGRCPYCQQALPADFAQQVAQTFDAAYETGKRQIADFHQRYRAAGEQLMKHISSLAEDSALDNGWQDYQARLMMIGNTISENLRRIERKLQAPSEAITLTPLAPYLGDLSDLLTQWNRRITAHNEAIDNRVTQEAECTRRVKAALISSLRSLVPPYAHLSSQRRQTENALARALSELEAELEGVKKEIAVKQSQFANVGTALTEMNRLLAKAGFQDFRLEESAGDTYRLVRPDGSPAESLSEGEKQFLAYLYFCARAFGKTSETDAGNQKKILVIDDPASLMDPRTRAAAAALTRELITTALAFADPTVYRKKFQVEKEAPLAALFLFTHDADFYANITGGLETEWDHAAFFLLQKEDGRTAAALAARHTIKGWQNHLVPLGSADDLWRRYASETDPQRLLLLCRQITAAALPPKGFDRVTLRNTILANKNQLLTEDGSPAPFRIAVSFLTYLDQAAITYSGITHMPPATAVPLIKETLRRLFTCLRLEKYLRDMEAKYSGKK